MTTITVYVALICDRHKDPDPYLFTMVADAIAFARSKVRDLARAAEDIEEQVHPIEAAGPSWLEGVKGLLWSAVWNEEGDWAGVYERTLDLDAGSQATVTSDGDR